MSKPTVVIGFLGTQLDSGMGRRRWEKWRPSVSLCRFDDFMPARVELLVDQRKHAVLALQVVADMRQSSPSTQVQLHDFSAADPWDFQQMYACMFDFVRAYEFDTETNDYLINITTGTHVAQICWFLLTEARFAPARLMQLGPPRNQSAGDPGSFSIIDLDLARYDAIATRFAKERTESTSALKSGIPTRNAAFNQMISQIEQIAIKSRAPILLMGPTGAGKSMLAKNLFALKKVRQDLRGRMVEVNCATLRGDSASSALFGHVRGAFTGAQSERSGYLKSADAGLLFLDEIGELGLDEQALLLRAIEEKRFAPMGSDTDISSNFQLIAGTNIDLAVAMGKGRFREDLFARLNLWTFDLPSLKQRFEDIAPNLDYELERFARQNDQRVTFNTQARERYLNFAASPNALWLGNFRDLSASVTRMATLSEAGRINTEGVNREIGTLERLWSRHDARTVKTENDLLAQILPEPVRANLDRFDEAQLRDVLTVCGQSSSLSDAGRALFQSSRSKKTSSNDADRLKKYLARFGLQFVDIKALMQQRPAA